ncbi:Methyltransferase type 11 (fragment) [Parafrankia sp. Ea1.12]
MNVTGDGGQAARWNGPAGQAWAEAQTLTDRMFKPFEDLLVDAVSATGAGYVLDVGGGTGATTVALARRLGAQGRCVGVDISDPMLAAARARAERDEEGARAVFIRADAQDHAFEPAAFDAIVSRFGVMFFGDSVAAFANLRRAAADGPGSTSGRSMRPVCFPNTSWSPTSPGSARSVRPCGTWTSGLAGRSSKRPAPRSIPMCTAPRSVSPRPAGWSAPRPGEPDLGVAALAKLL